MSVKFLSVLTLAIVLQAGVANADDPVRIITGGPSTAKKMAPIKAELEKAAGGPVEVSVNPVDVALISLSKGVVDAVVGPLEETFSSAEKRAGTKFNRDDYQWFDVTKSVLNIGIHPSNPSTSLSNDQIKGILSGQIKTWEPINGQKTPIKLLMAKNYVAAMKTFNQHYLKADTSPVAEVVTNKDGLLNGIKANPGAIGVFTAKEQQPDFSPKWIATEVTMNNAFITKKTAREPARKVYEYLKSHPDAIID